MTILMGRTLQKLHHNARYWTQYFAINSDKCAVQLWRSLQSTSGSMCVFYTRTPSVLSGIGRLQCSSQRFLSMFLKSQKKFKPKYKKDCVPKDYELIYENNMRNYYKMYPIIVYSTILPALCIAASIIWKHHNEKWENINIEHPLALAVPMSVFGVTLCLLCMFVSRRNVIRMYLNTEQSCGIAIVPDKVLWRKQLPFKMEDCSRIPPTAIQYRGNLRIKNRSFIVVGTDFVVSKYYNDMMGWAVPEDETVHDIDLSKLIKRK